MPTQESDPRISRDSIASALKNLNQLETLGAHSLSQLGAVKARRAELNLPDTPRGRGAAVQHVLQEFLDALKPAQTKEAATGASPILPKRRGTRTSSSNRPSYRARAVISWPTFWASGSASTSAGKLRLSMLWPIGCGG